MRRGATLLLSVLFATVSCGGGSGKGGATGTAGGTAGQPGTAGQQGVAGQPGAGGMGAAAGAGAGVAGQGMAGRSGGAGGGTSGHAGAGGAAGDGGRDGGVGTGGVTDAATDAAHTDARRDGSLTDGATCTVAVDGGSVPCTTALVGSNQDYLCALKGGALACWGPSVDTMIVPANAAAVAKAPPNLEQVSMFVGFGYPQLASFCGVDTSGRGTCWDRNGSTDLGGGIAEVAVSESGSCALAHDGSISCSAVGAGLTGEPPIENVPVGPHYVKMAFSLYHLMALDDAGTPQFRGDVFPSGVYVDLATTYGGPAGLVRSDGSVLTFESAHMPEPTPPTVTPGSFTRLALDEDARACAIDRAGAITCWVVEPTSTSAPKPLTVPAGSFTQIVAGANLFCALRTSGTTVCWGDLEVDVPAGW
ncbi:MAG TPA: hypothetical protein VI456_04300 [Polyangia bacterium]